MPSWSIRVLLVDCTTTIIGDDTFRDIVIEDLCSLMVGALSRQRFIVVEDISRWDQRQAPYDDVSNATVTSMPDRPFKLICEIEPPTRPDLKHVRH